MIISDKDRGHLAVLKFLLAAEEREIDALTPTGDNRAFDSVLHKNGMFCKVQVKSTTTYDERGTVKFSLGHGKGSIAPYTADEIDLFALYCHSTRDWWLIPQSVLDKQITASISVEGKYSSYKNNWKISCLLTQEQRAAEANVSCATSSSPTASVPVAVNSLPVVLTAQMSLSQISRNITSNASSYRT